MDLSWVQYIKIFVQGGAWVEAILLTCKTACRWLRLTSRAIDSKEPPLKWYCGSYEWHIPQFQVPERNVLGTSYYFHGVLFLTLNKQTAERFRDALACHTITRDQGGAVLCTWSSKCWTGAPRPAGNTRERSSVNGIWGFNEAWFIYAVKRCGERKQPYKIDKHIPCKTFFIDIVMLADVEAIFEAINQFTNHESSS